MSLGSHHHLALFQEQYLVCIFSIACREQVVSEMRVQFPPWTRVVGKKLREDNFQDRKVGNVHLTIALLNHVIHLRV